jgi:mycothiol synthase
MRPTPYDAARVRNFLALVADADAHPPLSEHKIATMGREASRVGVWSDDVGIVLVAVASHHDGGGHWAVEAALAPRRREAVDEVAAIKQAAGLVTAGEAHTIWSFRSDQVGAAERLGYHEVRAVLRMSGPMRDSGVNSVPAISINPMTESDLPGVVAVNNRAFVDHREQASLTEDGFRSLMRLNWFDPGGVLVARSKGRIAGFCVTKHEEHLVGEVYLLAVDPALAGSGVGRALVCRGFAYLADRGAATARAWVDEANTPAVGLYQTLGLTEDFRNRELAPVAGE